MQYIVEISVSNRDFIDSMTQMRSWFDHRRIEPDWFRHASVGAGIIFRVDFSVEADASAFAKAFGGQVIGRSAATAGEVEVGSPDLR